MKTKLLIICVLILSLTGWADAKGSQRRVHVEREFVLRAGSEALVKEAGLKIKFTSLVEDSRCPEGVDCIWAGNGKIALTLRRGRHKVATIELNTMTEPKSVTYQGYEITLVKLAPYPKKDVQIKKGEYVATLVVRRKKP
jgi:hypothetical protein